MRKKLISFSLAGVILLAGAPAVLAQEASAETTDNGGQSDDDGFPIGLAGLLGLAGLAGLSRGDKNRRDDRDHVTVDNTRRNP